MKALIAAACLLASLGPGLADMLSVEDAYARSPRPGAPTGAVFMVIQNNGSSEDVLIAAESDAAQLVELHTHIEKDGVMMMRPVEDGFPIAAGGSHELARGGDHVMLMGLTEPLLDGGTLALTLRFASGEEMTLDVPVDNERGQGGHGN